MADETGAVKFTGPANTACDDVLGYEVKGEGGEDKGVDTTVLQPGDVVTGLPEEEIKRFLLNAHFEANDSVAEQAGQKLAEEEAQRATQARLGNGEISAAVLAGIASDEEVQRELEAQKQETPAEAQATRPPRNNRTQAAPETKATGEGESANAGEENA